ncbi:hypothetical protein ACIBO5_05590 [Nonomuraea angiospora]|uniref:hypothetical protein n=1 Tax=Nonomuraea angiospora TaxID=46172 RepID=UPI0029A2F5F8|nr:hypothetical protein [Nonomuraea angiospora]MDX3105934.1 hypothetical protein [Nonomuraea angiospora]
MPRKQVHRGAQLDLNLQLQAYGIARDATPKPPTTTTDHVRTQLTPGCYEATPRSPAGLDGT